MRKLIALFLIFSMLLCGCATGRTSSVPQSSVTESSTTTDTSSVSVSSSVPQSSSIVEDTVKISQPLVGNINGKIVRELTVEELNRANAALCFKRSDGIHGLRMIVPEYGQTDITINTILNKILSHGQFFDAENPYLDFSDKEEIEYLKSAGFDFDFKSIENGNERYARIPYSTINDLLTKYKNISLDEFTDVPENKYGVFYKFEREYGIVTTFECYDGVLTENGAVLCGNGYNIIFKREGSNYYIDYIADSDTKYGYIDGGESITDLYERNGTYFDEQRFRLREVYTESDLSKGNDYNFAVETYNKYLTDIAQQQTINYPETVFRYSVIDFNKDGVPELFTDASFMGTKHVYLHTVVDNRLVSHRIPGWGWGDPMKILRSGLAGVEHTSTGRFYNFYSLNPDGTLKKIEFGFSNGGEYGFGGETVSEERYRQLTDYYIDQFENGKEIEWIQFYEEIIY